MGPLALWWARGQLRVGGVAALSQWPLVISRHDGGRVGSLCWRRQSRRHPRVDVPLLRVLPKALAQFSQLLDGSEGGTCTVSPLGSHLTGQHHSLGLVQMPALG